MAYTKELMTKLDAMAKYVSETSDYIRNMNPSSNDGYVSDGESSFAYFNCYYDEDGALNNIDLVDICLPSYLCKSASDMACLPFNGNGKALLNEIERCAN